MKRVIKLTDPITIDKIKKIQQEKKRISQKIREGKIKEI